LVTVGRGPFFDAAVVVLRCAHRSRKKLWCRCRRGMALRQGHTLRRVWPPGLRRRRGRPGIRDGSMRIGGFCGVENRKPEMGTVFGVAVAGSVIVASMILEVILKRVSGAARLI